MPENRDDFDNFRKWQLNLRSWKTGNFMERSWKAMEFQKLKEYET